MMNTSFDACACMGKQGNDPLCPCGMRNVGLTPTNMWTEEKKQELYSVLTKYMKDNNEEK